MKISEWQNGDTVPEIPGIYQRYIYEGINYSYWDGEYWYVSGHTIKAAKQNYVKDKWRLYRPVLFRWRGVIE